MISRLREGVPLRGILIGAGTMLQVVGIFYFLSLPSSSTVWSEEDSGNPARTGFVS